MGSIIKLAGRCQPKQRLSATDRIKEACVHFQRMINEYRPVEIIIEAPSGKIHGRFAKTKMSALAIYGMAVGAIWAACRYSGLIADEHVHLINANEWTSQHSKNVRRQRAKALWSEYSAEEDPGADISDAICLLDWFCRHQELDRIKKS